MTPQIDVLSAQKCSCCLNRCVKSDPSSAVSFPDFLEDNWQTNGCVRLRIDCSVLFQWYDCDISRFSEKTCDHLLGSASCASDFCWLCLIFKHPHNRLLFIFGLTCVNPRCITCLRCHRRVPKHRDRIFGAFLSINRHKAFFERLTNCVGSNANKFF